MDTTILTEPVPRNPGPVAHPGAYLPVNAASRGAEYGAPGMSGIVSFTPQHAPGQGDRAGSDEPAPSLADVIGPAPAIGTTLR